MRVGDKSSYDQVKSTLAKNRGELMDLQNKAATLKRVTKPSDDPVAATRVLGFRTEQQANKQFLKSINQTKSFLEYADQSLGDLTDVLVRAKELAMSQANDASASTETRRLVAGEVEQLYQQAVQIGNRKMGDRFLFGGFKTTQTPFDFHGNYKGDDGEMMVPINAEASVAINIPGSRVFLGKLTLDQDTHEELSTREFNRPEDVEQVKKVQEHQEALEEERQENIGIRGPASVPQPVSHAPEEGSEKPNGFGLNSSDQKGSNIFGLLKKIIIGMKTDDKAAIQETIDDSDDAISQVVLARATIGARMSTLDSNRDSITKFNIDSKDAASQLEDVDTFEVISDINKTEATLQATLQTSGKIIQPSLLDFLR